VLHMLLGVASAEGSQKSPHRRKRIKSSNLVYDQNTQVIMNNTLKYKNKTVKPTGIPIKKPSLQKSSRFDTYPLYYYLFRLVNARQCVKVVLFVILPGGGGHTRAERCHLLVERKRTQLA